MSRLFKSKRKAQERAAGISNTMVFDVSALSAHGSTLPLPALRSDNGPARIEIARTPHDWFGVVSWSAQPARGAAAIERADVGPRLQPG